MPSSMSGRGMLRPVGKKRDEDRAVEDRIRAHIRQRMERRRLGVTNAARKLSSSQPNLTRILMGERGVSAGLAYRVSTEFQVDLEHLFHVDPPREFWRYYVPRPAADPDSASPSAARPTRRDHAGGGSPATTPAEKKHAAES